MQKELELILGKWFSAPGSLWDMALPYEVSPLMDLRIFLVSILFIYLWTPKFLCVGLETIYFVHFS